MKIPHHHPNATISKDAFLTMLASCIEVYKKETIGILLGESHKKHYKISDALPYQTAERGYNEVRVPGKRLRRINYVVKHTTRAEVLGFYHSHPDYPDYLSGVDRKEHIQEKLPIQILVLVKRARNKRKWKFHEDMSISGTVGTRYFIKLRAYAYDKKLKAVHPIKIVCPFLRTMTLLESL